MIKHSRRTMLKTATAGVIAPVGMTRGLLAAKEKTGWIDAHSHIWTRDTQHYPLRESVSVDELSPPSFTAEELIETASKVRVDRVVLIAHHTYYGYDNSYLIAAARQFPGTFKVVGLIDETKPRPATTMKQLLPQHVTGFRITPWIRGDGWLESPGMQAMWKGAAETGQAICCLIDADNLQDVDKSCGKFPDTRVVIDHFARIGVDGQIRDADVRRLCALARHQHTYVKVSAFYALGKKAAPYDDLIPMIRKVYDAFGPQRLMWASDAPYQVVGGHDYPSSIALVRDRLEFLSSDDREWLLRKTAEKVYFRS